MARDASDQPGSTQPDRNPDPITGAPGSHPMGTGIGAAAGGATGIGAAIAVGAATGSVAGPIGTAIGIIAGAIVGGFAGKAIGEKNDPTEDDSYWRDEHANRPYFDKDKHDYDRDLAPAYRYGSTIGASTNDQYPDTIDRDATASTGTGVGGVVDDVKDGARNVGHKIADAGRAVKDKLTPGSTPDAATSDAAPRGTTYDTHEADIRAGWDKVRGNSSLSYDDAQHAIRDAYDRRSLKLREEQLQVGKERVQTGEASIRKEIVTEHKQVDVPLQREELVIERRAVSGEGTQNAGTINDAETIRIPLSEERATISKNTVVTEEVSVGKKVLTDTKTVGADVRKEQLKVDEGVRTSVDTATSTNDPKSR